MKALHLVFKIITGVLLLSVLSTAIAGIPLWTFHALTATDIVVPANGSATVQYQITNQSNKPHTLVMQPVHGVSQTTTGFGICGNPFVLTGKASCVLSLQINGSELQKPISDGPIVCQQGSTNQCYRPAAANLLHVTQATPISGATISVSGSPLILLGNGPSNILTITNNSLDVTATNIISDFTGTALDGRVTEVGNTCGSVSPGGFCNLTYTASGGAAVPQTDFTIQGTNTNTLTAAITIVNTVNLGSITPASGPTAGGTGVVLSGTGLAGATSVTFGGVAATSVNTVDPSNVTAVTPAHAAGAVDVTITTPSGSSTLTNGYTYVATTIGQLTGGGIVACLGGSAPPLDLIAATANVSNQIWGDTSITTGATDDADGAANTTTIVGTPGEPTPNAASVCDDYEVDSQGNTPCEIGNTCYSDWFLPAKDQLNCLYTNKVTIGIPDGPYWSSTEDAQATAWAQLFQDGSQGSQPKNLFSDVRCVRGFTP